MTGPPQVSVVMPTFDRARLVGRAVRSVLAQAGPSFELIVVDDSSDDTGQVLAAIGDPRLRVVRPVRRRGAGAARNEGVKAARAAWIAFADDDDEWLPGKLSAQWRAAQRSPDAAVVYGDMERVLADGRRRPYPAPPPPSGVIGRKQDWSALGISIATCLVRRDALAAVGGFDESLGALEDLDLLLRLLPEGRFLRLEEPLNLYHQTPGGVSSDLRKTALARAAILAKHRAVLEPHQVALQVRRIGTLLCSAGDLPEGRRHLWDAWRRRRWRLDGLVLALAATTPTTYRLARGLRRSVRS